MSEVLPPIYPRLVSLAGAAVLSGVISVYAANFAQAAVERPTDQQIQDLQTVAAIDQGDDQANRLADKAYERIESTQEWHDTIYRGLRIFGALGTVGCVSYGIYAFWNRPQTEAEELQVSVSQ